MKGSNVLIVDTGDSAYIRDLQNESYNIEIAESVPAAIEQIEGGSFDAAVINIDLVGLNLLPTIAKLCPETVLIALSSNVALPSAEAAARAVEVMRMGFYDCVFYPLGSPSARISESMGDGIRALFQRREKLKDLAAIAGEKGGAQAIVQSMSDGLIVTGLSQRIVFCNSKATDLLSIDPRARAGWNRNISELIGRPVDLSAEGAKELELDTPVGTVLMRTQPVLDFGEASAGSQIGWVSVLTDITEVRKSAQLMSEAALRCTHEMRAPLGAIRNYLTVLLDGNVGSLNDRQRFMLTRMIKRVDALLELERDLLDLSSIESGSSTLDMELLSLPDSVREVVDIIRPSAAEKGVRMRLLVEPDPLVTRADSGAIKRIFTNLVSNAIKYTSSGGTVQVRVGRHDSGNAFVEVMDTGIGISADNMDRIFDKFFRVRDRQTAEIVGTGLGLPIVKALVDAHSGEIKLDSEVGRGSTFTIFLPIAEAAVVHERESKVIDSEKYILLSDLDPNFKDEISREPGGENIKHCFSCGTCVAACPVRWINEKYNPRKIIRMALLGMREQVLKSEFIWLCSTCYTCHERCPQEVRITDVMNVLKNMASREGYIHPAYVRQVNTIGSLGRLYEIDDFDNRKRERAGLPRISTDPQLALEVGRIFEITGINELVRAGKS
jgi:two-component system phosphate regulon sensor histidine kinase PhoR